jgi:chaperonin GroES
VSAATSPPGFDDARRAAPSSERKETVMEVRPLHDRLLVRRLEENQTSKSGIIIPDSAREKPQTGEVLAVGDGRTLDNGTRVAPEVKPGDRILFGKYAGTELTIDGDEVLIVREDEVLAVHTK